LPEIVVLDFGNRHVELLQAILHASEHRPFVLQRLASGYVHLDGQQAYNHEIAGLQNGRIAGREAAKACRPSVVLRFHNLMP
jgi:hypothetical protein